MNAGAGLVPALPCVIPAEAGIQKRQVLPMSLYLFVTYVLDSYNPREPALRVRSLTKENSGRGQLALLRQGAAVLLNFPALAHRVQRGV